VFPGMRETVLSVHQSLVVGTVVGCKLPAGQSVDYLIGPRLHSGHGML